MPRVTDFDGMIIDNSIYFHLNRGRLPADADVDALENTILNAARGGVGNGNASENVNEGHGVWRQLPNGNVEIRGEGLRGLHITDHNSNRHGQGGAEERRRGEANEAGNGRRVRFDLPHFSGSDTDGDSSDSSLTADMGALSLMGRLRARQVRGDVRARLRAAGARIREADARGELQVRVERIRHRRGPHGGRITTRETWTRF